MFEFIPIIILILYILVLTCLQISMIIWKFVEDEKSVGYNPINVFMMKQFGYHKSTSMYSYENENGVKANCDLGIVILAVIAIVFTACIKFGIFKYLVYVTILILILTVIRYIRRKYKNHMNK